MKLNETLESSLQLDLKRLNTVKDNILVKCGETNHSEVDTNINSWLFPTKTFEYVDQLFSEKDLNYNNYLELLLDRCYITIRLLVNYIKYHNKDQKRKFVIVPNQISLGASLDLLWKNVCALIESTHMPKKKFQPSKEVHFNQFVQTDIMTSSKCDSCSAAMSCMKNLMNRLDASDEENIVAERRKIKSVLYDLTQFGSMLKACVSVEQCLNLLFDKLRNVKLENQMIKSENEAIRKEIVSKGNIISVLEREVQIFRDKCEQDRVEILLLNDQKSDLECTKSKNEVKIRSLEDMLANVNNILKVYRKNLQSISSERDMLNIKFHTLYKTQKVLFKSVEKLQNRFLFLENENDQYVKYLQQMGLLTANLEGYVDNINRISETNKEKLSRCCEHTKQNFENVEEKFRLIKKKVLDVKQKENIRYKVQGNPIEDMTKQIEENTKKIQELQEENAKLERIVSWN